MSLVPEPLSLGPVIYILSRCILTDPDNALTLPARCKEDFQRNNIHVYSLYDQ